jgi:hypothetical protein
VHRKQNLAHHAKRSGMIFAAAGRHRATDQTAKYRAELSPGRALIAARGAQACMAERGLHEVRRHPAIESVGRMRVAVAGADYAGYLRSWNLIALAGDLLRGVGNGLGVKLHPAFLLVHVAAGHEIH